MNLDNRPENSLEHEKFEHQTTNETWHSSLKNKWLTELKKWPQNLNTAVALVAIIIPNALFYVTVINESVHIGSGIKYHKMVLGVILGFLMSAIFNGGGLHFKTFTMVQAFVLMVQMKTYGVASVSPTCIGMGLIMLMMVYMRLHKVIKVMPYSILVGFQFSMGSESLPRSPLHF